VIVPFFSAVINRGGGRKPAAPKKRLERPTSNVEPLTPND